MASRFVDVDAYIATLDPQVATVVSEMRRRIHAVVPGAEEVIRYDIPTIQLDGASLVHFAGWKHHVSVYPVPDGDADLMRDVAPYNSGKGTAKFPLTEPVPYALIERLVAALLVQRSSVH